MEDVFEPRIRRIFDGLASGRYSFVERVVIPRTSEQEHKLYLYLREAARMGLSPPPVSLYNLLQTDSEESRAYGVERTRELCGDAPRAALLAAIARGNQARRALAGLLHLRDGPSPRISGTEALPLIGAYYFMDRAEYAEVAGRAVAQLVAREPLPGPRLLIKGSPLDHTGLHQELESHGSVVVAEDDWWGSRALTAEISTEGDLAQNIFSTYYDAPSPRAHDVNAWFCSRMGEVDGVVFYLPPEDDVAGWDYPALRDLVQRKGIPQLLLRCDGRAITDEARNSIAAFAGQIRK